MKDSYLTIYRLIAREVEIDDFERWVYAEKGLEDLLGPDEYLGLISLDYRLPSSLYEAEKILRRYIDIGDYHEWYLRRVLQKVIDRTEDAHESIEQCYDLYCDGYDFLDNLGLGYGLSIAVPPSEYGADTWDALASAEQKRLIDGFYPDVRQEAEKVLRWLDTRKIVLTGQGEGTEGIQYQDNRTAEERKPTGYKVAAPARKWWKPWGRHR